MRDFSQDIIIHPNIDIYDAAIRVCAVQPHNIVIWQSNHLIRFVSDIFQKPLFRLFCFEKSALMPCGYGIDEFEDLLFPILRTRFKITIHRNENLHILIIADILCKQKFSGRLQIETANVLHDMPDHKRELFPLYMQLIRNQIVQI